MVAVLLPVGKLVRAVWWKAAVRLGHGNTMLLSWGFGCLVYPTLERTAHAHAGVSDAVTPGMLEQLVVTHRMLQHARCIRANA